MNMKSIFKIDKIITTCFVTIFITLTGCQDEDLFETKYDPLSKKLRQLLRKKNILKHNVAVCLTAPQIKTNKTTSIVYHPCVCGAVLSAFVVNELFLIK